MSPRTLLVPGFVLALCLGCHKGTVESYRIPKEKDPGMPFASNANGDAGGTAGGGMANTAVPTAEGAGLAWSAPADWKVKPASAMRKGSYSVPGSGGADGDLSITAFPGDVGGELANVNRWRGQVQLGPIGEADLPHEVQRLESNGLTLTVVDVKGTGANAQRILGALVPYEGATWFIKLSGPDNVVGPAKPAFLAFLKTVKPAAQ